MSLSESITLCAALFYGSAFLAAYIVYNLPEWKFQRALRKLGKTLDKRTPKKS